jgi:hypothetical protein
VIASYIVLSLTRIKTLLRELAAEFTWRCEMKAILTTLAAVALTPSSSFVSVSLDAMGSWLRAIVSWRDRESAGIDRLAARIMERSGQDRLSDALEREMYSKMAQRGFLR